MKKLVWIGLLAAAALPCTASALDTNNPLNFVVQGFEGARTYDLGAMVLVGVGAVGPYCDYWGAWANPVNPNDTTVCILHELRTAFAPSCILNEQADFLTSIVTTMDGVVTHCSGSTIKNESVEDIVLILGEAAGARVSGLMVFADPHGPDVVYPVVARL